MQTTERLRVLEVAMEAIAELGPLVRRVAARDRDLANQLRRAASSIALNIGEAAGSDPGNRRARLHTAMGSARETSVALRVAVAWGYVGADESASADALLDRVSAMLWRWLHPRR